MRQLTSCHCGLQDFRASGSEIYLKSPCRLFCELLPFLLILLFWLINAIFVLNFGVYERLRGVGLLRGLGGSPTLGGMPWHARVQGLGFRV